MAGWRWTLGLVMILGSNAACATARQGIAAGAAIPHYTVQAGDTIFRLAQRFDVGEEQLLHANRLEKPQNLRAGAVLVVPAARGRLGRSPALTRKVAAPHKSGPAPKTPPKVATKRPKAAKGQGGRLAQGLKKAPPKGRPNTSKRAVARAAPAPAKRRAPAPVVAAARPAKPWGAPSSVIHRDLMRWPINGVITSPFGSRGSRMHDGLDIGAPQGSPVRAAADGEVVFSAAHRGYGNLVILRHIDGLMTIYAHQEANLVHTGQRVRRGDQIARVGSTGHSTGPHLHFEIRRGTLPDNPMHYLPPR